MARHTALFAFMTACLLFVPTTGGGSGADAWARTDAPTTAVPTVTQPTGDATPTVETTPVTHSGDAADDPAIWRDPIDPSRSIIIGNDKLGALEVYDLSGARLQQLTGGFYGNVDTSTALPTGTGPIDIAVTYRLGLRVYKIDPETRLLANVTDTTSGSIDSPIGGEGVCLYRSPVDGSTYAFVNARDGQIAQVLLSDRDDDGLVEGSVVRQWDVGSEVEGCVADDELGDLYISEEDVAIWKYGAEPTASTTARAAVDRPIDAGGHIRPDAEGLTIVYQPNGTGYLIASSQAASDTLNSYLVYQRQGNNEFVREFKVVDAPGVADGCGRTDGIDALAADLGPAFPHGVFICQDNTNTEPGTSGNQNFKLVPLERVVGLVDYAPADPVASFTADCAGLTCALDGSGSSDADGSIANWAWDFGDGMTGTGVALEHTYAADGSYDVVLTVTDDRGATASTTRTVVVAASVARIDFIDASSVNTNWTQFPLAYSSQLQVGDVMLLFFVANNTTAVINGPVGWTNVGGAAAGNAAGRVWMKVAEAGDLGGNVLVTTSVATKGDASLMTYRGVDQTTPIADAQVTLETTTTTTRTTPAVTGVQDGVLVGYWGLKSSGLTTITPSAPAVLRTGSNGSGGGQIDAIAADLGPVTAGPLTGLTATSDTASSRGFLASITLAPQH